MEDSSPSVDMESGEEDVKIVDDAKLKKRQKTSEVWKNFSEDKPDKDGKNIKCNHCGQRWKYEGTKQGTSTFSRHMLVCKKKPTFGDVGAMLKAKSKVIDPKVCRDWMTKISVAHDLPLNWVEYKYMRGFMQYLNSNIKFICRNTLASDVMDVYESEKKKLKNRLNDIAGMLCLTSDCWTSCTNLGYICVTAHYVDEKWKLNSKILAFCSMPPPHSGPELAQKIYDILVDWKIDRKVFSLTLDNASANTAMVKILKTRLDLQNALLCKGDYFHVRCCAHILRCCTSYPTSNLYFMEVWKIARLLEVNARSKDEVVKSMSLAMQSRFEKYWEEYSDILSMGAVFDPRMKLKLLEYCYSKIDPISSSDKINILKMKLHVLYDEYKRKGVGVSLFKVPQSSSSSSSQVRELEFREKGGGVRRQELGRGLNLNDKELEEYKSYKGGTSDSKSLLDIYLEEAPMDEKVEIDLLMYWKDNASRFGELARMACDVLSIPITTVASESSFSIGAHVLNKYRNRLLPERVQALICTRNWLHGYSDDGEDDEEEDMDQVGAPNVINVEEECYSNI